MNHFDFLISHFNQKVKLNEAEKELLIRNFVPTEFSKGEIILFQGEVSSHMRFIVEGCLKTYYLDEKTKEHVVHFGIEGWWVNDLYSYFTGTPATLFIEALENGIILQIHRDTLERLFEESQQIERFFRLKFQSAYVAFQDRTININSQPAEQRYKEFCEKYRDIEQRVPQYQLASYLGITPEFLSRLRKRKNL